MMKVRFVFDFDSTKEVKVIAESLQPEIKHKIPKTNVDVSISEKTFSQKNGIANLPKDSAFKEKNVATIPAEIEVNSELRQKEFENYNTTDDHLMHLTGLVKDRYGNSYYKVKNSWGTTGDRIGNDGYIYMSIPYFKLKAISIFLHKDALDKTFKNQLKL